MNTNRRRIPRAFHAAVLVAVIVGTLGAVPVRGASAVDIEARALVGGRYAVGGWAAIAVTLVNEGAPTEGYVAADSEAGSVRRYVEMPSGARKVVMLYLQPGGFQRQVEVRYDEPNGTVRTPVEVRVLEQTTRQVGIVGDSTGALRPQVSGVGIDRPEPLILTAADIPERPEPLDGLAALVWAADSSSLGEAQRRSIERWVADGGQLVVIGGADWQARAAAFDGLLPAEDLAAVDGVAADALAAWAGVEEAPVEAATVSAGRLVSDGRPLVVGGDGTALISMRSVGAGRTILVGVDMGIDAFRGWDGAAALWTRLLPTSPSLDPFFGGGMPDREQVVNSMAQALNTLPALEVPPAELLLAVIVAYILLIGPVSYLVLRRIDRRELAWVTAPVLVVLFTACSYGIGTTLKGSDVIVNQIALIRSTPAGGTAAVETYAGVFSPASGRFDMLVEADALIAQMRSAGFAERTEAGATVAGIGAEQGDPARLRDLAIAGGGYEYVRADGVIDHHAPLSVSWSYADGALVGNVTNLTDEVIADVAFISMSGGEMIGDLDPGATADFTVDTRNVNQSSASDQIYGFGGFDTTDPAARRVAARRGVIDALVGYGNWAPLGSELGGAGGHGPYLIGWRDGEGPMPIEVEGQEAQRYGEIVEVVSVNPGIGSGEVVIGPAQMGVTVQPDGEVDVVGPGTAAILSGSATFGITLPLEASGMAVSELEIIVGPDPSTVSQDPGTFGGFWPAGFVVELLDPATGAWTLLGDLAEGNRFDIADPATVIGTTGRIEVRVSADEPDPNFGQPSVFVSARAEGVIGR
jgi:hypothetical protein